MIFCYFHSLYITFPLSSTVKKTTRPGRLVPRQVQGFQFHLDHQSFQVSLTASLILYSWRLSVTSPKSLLVFCFPEELEAIRREILKVLPTNIAEFILTSAPGAVRAVSLLCKTNKCLPDLSSFVSLLLPPNRVPLLVGVNPKDTTKSKDQEKEEFITCSK